MENVWAFLKKKIGNIDPLNSEEQESVARKQ